MLYCCYIHGYLVCNLSLFTLYVDICVDTNIFDPKRSTPCGVFVLLHITPSSVGAFPLVLSTINQNSVGDYKSIKQFIFVCVNLSVLPFILSLKHIREVNKIQIKVMLWGVVITLCK
jgi:hypothetical protein